MGATAVKRLAPVHSARLPVRVIDVDDHRVLQLLIIYVYTYLETSSVEVWHIIIQEA